MPSEREWREIAADQGQRVIRMRVALQILRAWSGRPTTDAIPAAIHGWIDGGMEGPVPWPEGAGFRSWAARAGLGNVGGYIGYWATSPTSQETRH